MRLSPRRKYGHLHVRASRLVRVVTEHRVGGVGISEEVNPGWSPSDRGGGFAQPGDLALELVRAKHTKRTKKKGGWHARKIVGYSYLTGQAIQAVNYHASEDDFEDAAVGRIEIPLIQNFDGPDAYMEAMGDVVLPAKFGELDLVCFEYAARSREDAMNVSHVVLGMYGYTRDDVKPRGHLIGTVRGGGHTVFIHAQPPQHGSDHAATGFQTTLALALSRRLTQSG